MDSCKETLRLSTMALLDRGQLNVCDDKYVTRAMKCLPDKFLELCHMHLAFLLDLSGDKLELLLSAQDEHKKKKYGLVSVGMFRKKDKHHVGLFGLPLTDEGVCLMIPLIKFLKMEKSVSKEGLFRKPGNKSRMATLRELLVARGSAISIDPEMYSPYDVACVLKEFLRELPEPLLTERYMEAHRQVAAIGQHSIAPEEAVRYSCRKLSALQLLMFLLPPPAQKLTLHLTRLLKRIADCPDSKMTYATLGTIFAPIFFIDRKVEPSELCDQIAHTAPAVSFMIEKANDLFHAPKELVIDLVNYWHGLGQAPRQLKNTPEAALMKKSLSGRTLNTNVCYIDRELSRCDDVVSNTQAELANLLAHVQSLPSTPHNAKLKKQIMKSGTTPVLSGKRRRRSRSIGASIKKRLPSLGRFRNKQGYLSRSSSISTSSTHSKSMTPAIPEISIEIKPQQKPQRPGQKRHYISDCDDSTDIPIHTHTPSKQKCMETDSHVTPASTRGSNDPHSETGNAENKDPLSLTSFPKLNDQSQIISPILLRSGSTVSQLKSDISSCSVKKQGSVLETPNRNQASAIRVHRQHCRKQGTPIMSRAVLRLVENNTAESSF